MRIENQEVRQRFSRGPRCEWCRAEGPVQCAHLHARGRGAGWQLDVPINLLSLCPECHATFHQGNRPKGREKEKADFNLLALVAQREKCLQRDLEEALWTLERLPKDPYTTDVEKELARVNQAVGYLVMKTLVQSRELITKGEVAA
jgi:hypothetical protein